ncbi:hypothetical protein T4D_6091 [Trichinella pseudospiralis]|uniref:Uncharacterized protein n=1 Tax=Trichinella pseudospiralis TaxID=6337 RepID=A0A0V1FJE5_TRIPS|nr:hypothetical protein T4D_6091 [Trichinella pseudospiralis]
MDRYGSTGDAAFRSLLFQILYMVYETRYLKCYYGIYQRVANIVANIAYSLYFSFSYHYLNVTIDTQDEKVEASDNVSCKANTEGKATHKNLHENSGKQLNLDQIISSVVGVVSLTCKFSTVALTFVYFVVIAREKPDMIFLYHLMVPRGLEYHNI